MKIIARIYNDYKEKFGIPRQAGLARGLYSKIVFEGEYRNPEALRGIEGYSHLWLIFEFSKAKRDGWSPTVRPPRLGGNKRVGVFATRSPFRPNPIGLSSVKLLSVEDSGEGLILKVGGADLLDGTPIYDIKPYLPFTDSHPEARFGFASEVIDYELPVEFPAQLLEKIPEEKRRSLMIILSQDPRPSYKQDGEREYSFLFADFEISFKVENSVLSVTKVNRV